MGPNDDENNCNSTLGGLYASAVEDGACPATSAPDDPQTGTTDDPGEVVLCYVPSDKEPEAPEPQPSLPTVYADRFDYDWYQELRRPSVYADCLAQHLGSEHRPCPFASCEHHLMFRIVDGEIVLNFHTEDIDELPYTCAVHEASGDEMTLEAIALRLNISKERVRQLQNIALAKLKDGRQEPLREFEFWESERNGPCGDEQ